MSDFASETKSRYKIAGKKFNDQISAAEVPALVASLRDAFNSEKTRPLEWRISQLKALKRMLIEGEKEFCEALYGDIHKSRFESYVTELGTTLGELEYTIEHLSQWMKPEKKGNSPLTLPSWSSVQRDPLGVVLVMGSWNYPIYLSLDPVIGAIAGGNCVILKPGSYAVHSSHVLTKLITKYMDQDCVTVVEGNRDVTNALLAEKFDKIFFTGSGFVGKIVARAAAEHLTPCVLELGGKSPCIVDKSAKDYLDYSLKRIVWGCFVNCGQTCVRPDFILVHDDIKDEFLAKFKETVKNFYSENPKTTEWFARCINDAAFNRLADLVKEHKNELIIGGETDKDEKFIAPTAFYFGNDLKKFGEKTIMQDEIFGPLVPIASYKNIEDVVEFVKHLKTGKPLALYGFGTDKKFIDTIKLRTTSGGLTINDSFIHLGNHELPFGGVGNSGMGSYHGKYSFDCFTHEKAVCEKTPKIEDLPGVRHILEMRFPPYSKKKQELMKSVFNPMMGKVLHFLQSKPVEDVKKLLMIFVILRFLGFKLTR